MTSIPKIDDTSKYETNQPLVALDTHEATSGSGYKRTLPYREWRNRAAAALFEAGYEDESVDFLQCAELPWHLIPSDTKVLPEKASTIWVCDHDHSHDAALFYCTCDSRFCPDCAHRQVARFARRYVPAVLECAKSRGHDKLRHIVLTTPLELTDPEAPQKIAAYWNAVGRLWKSLTSSNAKWATSGTIEAMEFGAFGHKLHFHIIQYGRFLPYKEIAKAWSQLTGGKCEITHVRALAQNEALADQDIANEVIETLKYSVKFWSKDADGNVTYIDPELMPFLAQALKGKRRVRSRGCFYNIPEQSKEPLCCETCGNEMLRVGVIFFPVWQETGFSPQEYRELVEGKSLHLILANKSKNGGGENNKSPPEQTAFWPEPVDTGQADHYTIDESKHRKAF